MKIYIEESLTSFGFWGGAINTVNYLTEEEIDTIELMLENCCPDGMSTTQINEFFWFNTDTIAECLGFNSFEEIMDRNINAE